MSDKNIKLIDLKRFFSLLKLDFNIYGKQIFLAPIIVNIIYILNVLITIAYNYYIRNSIYFINQIEILPFFSISVFIGVILASNSFKHIHIEEKSISFYMLPVNQFEKFLSIWLYYFLFYLIFSALSSILAYLISNIIVFLITKMTFPLYKILTIFNYKIILVYFYLCSIFMLGSTYFKKASFFMTILSILIIAGSIGILISLTTFLLFNGKEIHISFSMFEFFKKFQIDSYKSRLIISIIQIALSFFFYFLTYLKISEHDVKGE